MWKNKKRELPDSTGFVKCVNVINEGTLFQQCYKFDAFFNGEKFTDQDGEDLTEIDESVDFWFDFNEVELPI